MVVIKGRATVPLDPTLVSFPEDVFWCFSGVVNTFGTGNHLFIWLQSVIPRITILDQDDNYHINNTEGPGKILSQDYNEI